MRRYLKQDTKDEHIKIHNKISNMKLEKNGLCGNVGLRLVINYF